MYLEHFQAVTMQPLKKEWKKKSLNFVFQSGIILKKFFCLKIKHVEIAHWNILADITDISAYIYSEISSRYILLQI